MNSSGLEVSLRCTLRFEQAIWVGYIVPRGGLGTGAPVYTTGRELRLERAEPQAFVQKQAGKQASEAS